MGLGPLCSPCLPCFLLHATGQHLLVPARCWASSGVSPASPPRETQGMEEQEAPGHKLATHLKVDAVADPRCVIMARSGHVELHGHIVFDVH